MASLQRPNTPRLDRFKVFGSTAFVHRSPETRPHGEKFSPRARKGYMIGYAKGNNFCIWIPDTNCIIWSAYVKFDETSCLTPILYNEDPPLPLDSKDLEDSVAVFVPANTNVLRPTSPLAMPPCLIPILVPPLGCHTPEELFADIDAIPPLPQVATPSLR